MTPTSDDALIALLFLILFLAGLYSMLGVLALLLERAQYAAEMKRRHNLMRKPR